MEALCWIGKVDLGRVSRQPVELPFVSSPSSARWAGAQDRQDETPVGISD